MKKRILSWILCMAVLLMGLDAAPVVKAAEEDENVIILDDQDAERHGNWLSGSSRGGKYGSSYTVLQKDSTGDTWIKWAAKLPKSGDYRVYYMQPDGVSDSKSIASAAPFTVHHAFGEDTVLVNQRKTGGKWELLGTYTFTDNDSYIQLSSKVEENNTMADAVKFEYIPENVIVDNTEAKTEGTWKEGTSRKIFWGENYSVGVRDESGNTWMEWTPNLVREGYYNVQIVHPDGGDSGASIASDAHYIITHAKGAEDLRVSQKDKGGCWETIGTYYFRAGTEGKVKLITDISNTANNTFGDAVRFEYLEKYEAPSLEVIVDNTEATGDIGEEGWHTSTWRSDYYGSNYLTTETGGDKKEVVYTPDLPQMGNYAVYYYGPKGEAAGVPYEIRHKDGLTVEKFDQSAAKQKEWNLIGIYPFAKGTGGSVTVRNEGSSTNVFSDALKFVLVDREISLGLMKWDGDWEVSGEGDSWKGTAQQGASVTIPYTARYTGYHLVEIAIPENAGELSSEVTVSCGETSSRIDLSGEKAGYRKAAVFYLEEGEDYEIGSGGCSCSIYRL